MHPETHSTLMLPQAWQQALAAYKGGRLAEAEKLCRGVIAANPGFFDALHLLAAIRSFSPHESDAMAGYDQALSVRPAQAETFNNRGLTLQQFKRFEDALASYDKALAIKPDYVDALYNVAVLLKDLGRIVEAQRAI